MFSQGCRFMTHLTTVVAIAQKFLSFLFFLQFILFRTFVLFMPKLSTYMTFLFEFCTHQCSFAFFYLCYSFSTRLDSSSKIHAPYQNFVHNVCIIDLHFNLGFSLLLLVHFAHTKKRCVILVLLSSISSWSLYLVFRASIQFQTTFESFLFLGLILLSFLSFFPLRTCHWVCVYGSSYQTADMLIQSASPLQFEC